MLQEVLKDESFGRNGPMTGATSPLIHARAETVALKPFFRQAFRTKRCLVLADGFYEWQRTGKGKVPYRITLKTDEPFAFAGIWSLVHDAQRRPWSTFAIITTAANRPVAPIHRMPVILHPQDEATWLNQETSPAQAQACLKPFPAHLLRISVVSPKVNSPAYNTPDLLQRVAPDTPAGAPHGQEAAPEAGLPLSCLGTHLAQAPLPRGWLLVPRSTLLRRASTC